MLTKTNQMQGINVNTRVGISNRKILIIWGALILFIGLLSSFAFAFGISAPYMIDDKIAIYPGETRDLKFVIQDSNAEGEITATAEILEGFEIAEITDAENEYHLLPGDKVPVNVRITIPEDAVIGQDSWRVRLSFSKAAGRGGPGLSFGNVIDQIFEVETGDVPPPSPAPPEEEAGEAAEGLLTKPVVPGVSNVWLYVIVGVVILLIIFLIIWLVRKNSKARKIQSIQNQGTKNF